MSISDLHVGETGGKSSSMSRATQLAAAELDSIRERRNWLIHQLYIRQEYIDCLSVIEAQLRDTEGTCEYALYVKGLLKRMSGALTESLMLLQAAVLVSPENVESRKQLGRAFYLLGRHAEALEVFHEAEALGMARGLREDWEVQYNIGMCHTFLDQYEEAVSAFVRSLGMQRHDMTFLQLGRALIHVKSYEGAISVYTEALEASPRNPELLAMLGQLHLLNGDTPSAFDYFGKCLTQDPTHPKAIVAASSIIQNNGEYDVALTKYRVAIARMPDSAQLWNNIGACYLGKKNGYAAVACLRKSIILAPFEWITSYNLGIAFLSLGRYASAFQYLSASISLRSHNASAYMYLGVCLSFMNDIENACEAYERSLSMDDNVLTRINYTITLLNSNMEKQAVEQLRRALSVWGSLSDTQKCEYGAPVVALVHSLQDRLLRTEVKPAPAPAPPVSATPPAAPAEAEAEAVAAVPMTKPGVSSSIPAVPTAPVSGRTDSASVVGTSQHGEDELLSSVSSGDGLSQDKNEISPRTTKSNGHNGVDEPPPHISTHPEPQVATADPI